MGMGFGDKLKLAAIFEKVCRNHPKLPAFIQGVKGKGVQEGMEIAVAVRYPDGSEYKAGIRVTASDLEQLEKLKELQKDK